MISGIVYHAQMKSCQLPRMRHPALVTLK